MAQATAAAGLHTIEIGELAALADLEPEWALLFVRARGVTPFLHPAWLLPWCDAFRVDRIRSAIVRDTRSGQLVAILPGHEAAGSAQLRLLGGDVSDHHGPVIVAGPETHAGRLLWEWAEARRSVLLDDLPPEHPWAIAPVRPGWRRDPACVCPVVRLPASLDHWRQGLGHGLRRNLRRYRARLEQLGRLEMVLADNASVTELIECFLRLHGARWHAHGRPGALDDDAVRRFHRASGPRLLRAGLLRLHALRLDEQVIAVQHVLVHRERACSYLAGYDPALAHLSVGSILLAAAIEHAIEDGCRTFDFLRGVEPYKYTWGAVDETTWRVTRAL